MVIQCDLTRSVSKPARLSLTGSKFFLFFFFFFFFYFFLFLLVLPSFLPYLYTPSDVAELWLYVNVDRKKNEALRVKLMLPIQGIHATALRFIECGYRFFSLVFLFSVSDRQCKWKHVFKRLIFIYILHPCFRYWSRVCVPLVSTRQSLIAFFFSTSFFRLPLFSLLRFGYKYAYGYATVNHNPSQMALSYRWAHFYL